MNHKKYITLLLIALLALVAVPTLAQEDYPANAITVTGFGTASGAPDIANLEIGVDTEDPDVRIAYDNANATIDNIIAALVEVGVAREDIRTTGLNIFQDRFPVGPPTMMPETSGMAEVQPVFRVNNQVRVTIRDIDMVGTVIGAAVEAGANNVYGLSFGIDDRAALESEARAAAIADAEARASELAELVGAELGDVIIITEGYVGSGPFDAFNMSVARLESVGGGASIEPGQLTVTTQVQVTYSMNR